MKTKGTVSLKSQIGGLLEVDKMHFFIVKAR